jgi:hypothetical protein
MYSADQHAAKLERFALLCASRMIIIIIFSGWSWTGVPTAAVKHHQRQEEKYDDKDTTEDRIQPNPIAAG